MSLVMILAAAFALAFSGVPGFFLPARSPAGPRIAAILMLAGGALGLCGVASALTSGSTPAWVTPWVLPWGSFAVGADAISAVFLAPVFIIPALGAVYGISYWPPSEHPGNSRRLGLFYGLLAGSMALVVVARDGVLFLIAWEAMALSAYFAATADEDNAAVRRAGWVYLIATHMGTLCLIALFTLWRRETGSFELDASAVQPSQSTALFLLTLIGFGFKAGLMPLHVWLPGAHANAPSHVSAVMSGVMLKMGVYGIVRMTSLLTEPAVWWGGTLLAAGAVSAVAGIAFAIGQQDIKRLLAYSSIENIGIIALGLGLALLGRALGHADWVMLGLAGAFLHVWNHSLFKPLLFFNAGAVIHSVHTRDMDLLGGLSGRMPRVAGLFVVGAVAICALPPLNGFVGEWLLYIGLFRTAGLVSESGFPAAAAAAAALAMTGALAVACFVKLFGTVFLGSPRGPAVNHAHDPDSGMMLPMIALAAGCAALGLFPSAAVPLLERAAQTWGLPPGASLPLSALAPLRWISIMGLALLAAVAALMLTAKLLPRGRIITRAGTWDCGYARPSASMQYTGSSFGQMLVDLFAFALWPRRARPAVAGILPGRSRFVSSVPDTVLDRIATPLFEFSGRNMMRLRILHQGSIQLYVLYVLIIVIALLVWGTGEVPS